MKPYLLSLGAGLFVGLVYSLLGVRSPAPPAIALIGLLGILLGEQLLPVARRLADTAELGRFVRNDCANHILGTLPANRNDPAEERAA
ncbi:MAG: XapX domain-containing protein [Sphingobium sp.]|jgi:XapX domain-containing protein|nr:MAG: XapX domain-containing protein [Sphingobium sp.]